MSNTILTNFKTIISRPSHPTSASLTKILNCFVNTDYQNTTQVALGTYQSNANKQMSRVAKSQSSQSYSGQTLCKMDDSSYEYNTYVKCTVNDDNCTVLIPPCQNLNNKAWVLGHNNKIATYYMYNSSNSANSYCNIGTTIFKMSFTNTIICTDVNEQYPIGNPNATVEDLLLKYMGWYWQIQNPSGMTVSSGYSPSNYTIIEAPNIINSTTIELASGSTNNNCYKTPNHSQIKCTGELQYIYSSPSTNPNYGCIGCCNGFENSSCPNNSCKCIGYTTYFMYDTNQFYESDTCFYNIYYSITMKNMVIGYGSSSSAEKNIKKYIFWLSGLSGYSLDISNFTLSTKNPGGTAVQNYNVSGFGIEDITKGSSCYNKPTYFSIGLTASGNVSSPYVGGCNECPPGI
jgi:hypothetical protein